MRLRRSTAFLATLALLPVAACQDQPTAIEPAVGPTVRAEAGAPPSGLGPFTLGYLVRSHPASPCTAPSFREFDFWLGDWNVDNPAGQQVGTNRVVTRADGCIVEENWTSSTGVRGRSINAWDPETGMWSQTWVSAFAPGHLRMYGGLDAEGRMLLDGQRVTPNGTLVLDRYRWTVLPGGEVKQEGRLEVPSQDVVSTFTGIYSLTDDFQPAPEADPGHCSAGGISGSTRKLDFLVGSWSVQHAGDEIGTAEVSTDLTGCLFEEVFRTPRGYEAVSYTYQDIVVGSWYRTYIDSEGERMEVSGGFQGDDLVLSGSEAGRGASGQVLDVRIRWTPMADGTVEVTHESSADGGASWSKDLVLDYVPS